MVQKYGFVDQILLALRQLEFYLAAFHLMKYHFILVDQ
jgi:hypothetical protein